VRPASSGPLLTLHHGVLDITDPLAIGAWRSINRSRSQSALAAVPRSRLSFDFPRAGSRPALAQPMSRTSIVAGNWKMYGSRAENASLIEALAAQFPPEPHAACVVCPPYVYLQEVARLLRDAEIPVALGAQDVCAEHQGAYTGEVSASMLKDVGCEYVIVGHSERRLLYGERDQFIARKFAAAQARGLVPILCVGEQLWERESGLTDAVVSRQLDAVLELCGAQAFAKAVIAYEPCWAIGTGHNATPEQAEAVHRFIRGRIAERDARIAAEARILYGGSVKAGNAGELFSQPDVDGGLIGGASLKADEFLAILSATRAPSDRI
jgi:triosephosphate isomerase (TIM)